MEMWFANCFGNVVTQQALFYCNFKLQLISKIPLVVAVAVVVNSFQLFPWSVEKINKYSVQVSKHKCWTSYFLLFTRMTWQIFERKKVPTHPDRITSSNYTTVRLNIPWNEEGHIKPLQLWWPRVNPIIKIKYLKRLYWSKIICLLRVCARERGREKIECVWMCVNLISS